MAVTDFDFALTRNQIIEAAFRKCGLTAEGQPVSAEQIDEGRIALNELVKFLQTKHLFLWRLQDWTFNTVIGQASYTADDDPAMIAIDRASYLQSSDEWPLKVFSHRQYFDIPDKAETGDPIAITISNPTGQTVPTIKLWPVPNKVMTISVLGICRLQDWESASGSADFPARFQLPLIYELAAYLAEDYRLPSSDRDHLRQMADRYFLDAKRGDRQREDDDFVDGAI